VKWYSNPHQAQTTFFEAPVTMPGYLYVLFGFLAGLLTMTVISMYKYLFRHLNKE